MEQRGTGTCLSSVHKGGGGGDNHPVEQRGTGTCLSSVHKGGGGGGGGATILWNRGEREPVSHLYTRGG